MAVPIRINKSDRPALVDESDLDLVRGVTWYLDRGYARGGILRDGRRVWVQMHRLIMGAANNDGRLIDHIDGDGLNNTRGNLRVVTSAENARNRRGFGKRSQYKGVYPMDNGKWAAQITDIGHSRRIGTFPTEESAARAYDAAARAAFGEFARLNFPDVIHTAPPTATGPAHGAQLGLWDDAA